MGEKGRRNIVCCLLLPAHDSNLKPQTSPILLRLFTSCKRSGWILPFPFRRNSDCYMNGSFLHIVCLTSCLLVGCGPPSDAPSPTRGKPTWPAKEVSGTSAAWPRLLGPERSGVSWATGIRRDWLADGPTIEWETPVGSGYGSPVVAENRVVLLDRQGSEERIVCLDALSGDLLWEVRYATTYKDPYDHYSEGPYSTPVIDGPMVYSVGAQGQMYCVRLATGEVVWNRSLHEEYDVQTGNFPVAASPWIEDDLLIFNLGAQSEKPGSLL